MVRHKPARVLMVPSRRQNVPYQQGDHACGNGCSPAGGGAELALSTGYAHAGDWHAR